MKPRKLLAFLLAAVLTVSMIPLNASAALAPNDPDAKNILQVDLTVAPSLDGKNVVGAGGTYNGQTPTKAEKVADMAGILQTYDKDVFPAAENGVIEAAPKQVIFVGVKMKLANPGDKNGKTYKGIAGAPNLVLKFDGTKLTPQTVPSRIAINKAATTAVFDSDLLNIGYDAYGDGETNPDYIALAEGYRTSLTAPTITYKASTGQDTAEAYYTMAYGMADANSYLTQHTTWDYIIPFTVKEGSSGTTKIEVAKQSVVTEGTETSTSGTFSCQAMGHNDGTLIDVSLANTAENFAVTPTNENNGNYKTNDITVNILTNDASMALAAGSKTTVAATDTMGSGAEDEIQVELTNAAFKTSQNTAHWAVADGASSTGTTATISEVTVDPADAHKATVKLTGIKKGGDGKLVVKCTSADAVDLEASKTWPTAGVSVTVNTAIPPVTTDVVTKNDETGIVLDVGSGNALSYQVGNGAWVDLDTGTATIDEDALYAAALAAATDEEEAAGEAKTYTDLVKVAFKGSTEIYSGIDVEQKAKPAVETATASGGSITAEAGKILVDYANELINFGTGIVYTLKDKPTARASTPKTDVDADGSTIQLADYLDSTNGASVSAYTKPAGGAIRSFPNTITYARPAAPNVTAKADDATQKQGKTLLTGVANGMEYLVAADATALDWSAATAITGSTDLAVEAKTGEHIYVRTLAVANTSFASKVTDVTAYGNTYGTVTVGDTAVNSESVVLTIVGDTFKSANISDIDITNNNDNASVKASVAPSVGDTVATITLSGPIAEGEYTISVPTTAVTSGNAINNGVTTIPLTVSNNGYVIKLGTAKHNTSDPSSFTFNAVSGFQPSAETNGAKEIPYTMTNKYEKLTADDFTISAKNDAGEDVNNVGTLTLDAANGKIVFKPTNGEDLTEKITVTVDVNTEINVKTLALGDLDIANVTKDYDTTTTAPSTPAFSVTVKSSVTSDWGKSTVAVTPANGGAYEYETAAVGSGDKNIVATKGLTVDPASADKDYYDVDGALKAAKCVLASNGTINTVAITGIAATPKADTTYQNTQGELVKAIQDSVVKFNSFANSDGTVGTVFSEISAEDWKAIADAAVIAAGSVKSAEVPVDVSEGTAPATPTAVKIGDKVTFKLAEGRSVTSIAATAGAATGYTLANGEITIEAGAADATLTLTLDDASTVTGVQFTVTAAEADYDNVVGETLTATIPTDKMQAGFSADMQAIYTNTGSWATPLTVTPITLSKTPTGGGGSTTTSYTVTYDEGKHGTIISGGTYETVDEGMKPTNVPVVKADDTYTFVGWSKNGTTTVNPLEMVINMDTTFTALYVRGFVQGDGNGKVRPNDRINRAEFTKMLVTASGKFDPQVEYDELTFTDVKDTAWYAPYIACAVENGIVNGYTDNTFKPTASISREEAAQMIYNALDGVTKVETTDKITDFASVSNWAKAAVASLVEADIIKGYENGTFKPHNVITRAEAATMICRIEGFEPSAEVKAEIVKDYESPFTDMSKKNWAYAYILYACGELDDSFYA